MKRTHPAVFYFRVAMAGLALLLPLVSLLLLGSLWLWQQGYVLYWAIAACCVTVITYALERWLFRVDLPETAKTTDTNPAEIADPGWSARETAAWTAVVTLSKQVRPDEITSQEKAFELGVRAVETVARSMHPGVDHALWKFTLPEALALTERVSSQLSAFVTENIPLGDRMTVGQLLRVYRWRGAIHVAEQAYDLWRIIRLINPAAAATQELREQLTKRAYDWGREELAKRLAQAYVREVGKAAIELYSGRMRVLIRTGEMKGSISAAATGPRREDPRDTSEPIRILFAGIDGSGAAGVINRLIDGTQPPIGDGGPHDYEAREIQMTGGVAVLLIASPDLTETSARSKSFSQAAHQSDLIVWVTSADQPSRSAESIILGALREQLQNRDDRIAPPLVCVIIGAGKERLPNGVTPQDAQSSGTETGLNGLVLAIAAGLNFDVKDVVMIAADHQPAVSAQLIEMHLTPHIPAATRAKLLRIVEQSKGGMRWNRLWSQVRNAGRRTWSGSE